MSKTYRVAVVGATGAVGKAMRNILAERGFPTAELIPLASERSAGKVLDYDGRPVAVQLLTEQSFEGVDLALFSAGAGVSLKYAPDRPGRGVRGDRQLLGVAHGPGRAAGGAGGQPRRCRLARGHHRQPQLLHDTDGGGHEAAPRRGADQARGGLHLPGGIGHRCGGGGGAGAAVGRDPGRRRTHHSVYPYQIAFNCLPHIDVFLPDGSTKEEQKMVDETKKIMGDDSIAVTATCVRVPVVMGHSESVNVEFDRIHGPRACAESCWPTPPAWSCATIPPTSPTRWPSTAAGTDPVYVGRIRRDPTVEHGLNLWVVSDNVRKGAALNAVQIAELLMEKGLLRVPR